MTTPNFENPNLTKTDNLMINRILKRDDDTAIKREIVTITQQNELGENHLERLKSLLKSEREQSKQLNEQKFIDELATRYQAKDSDKRTKQQQFFLQVYSMDKPSDEQLALFNAIVTAEKRKVQANRKNKVVRDNLVTKPNAKKRELDNHKKYLIGGALLPMYESNKAIGGEFGNLTVRQLVKQLIASGELYKQVNEMVNGEKKPVRYVPFDSETGLDLFTLHGHTQSPHARKNAPAVPSNGFNRSGGTNTPPQP